MELEVFFSQRGICMCNDLERGRKMSRITCGIVSVLLAIVSWVIFWWLSIVAIVIGVVGLLLNREVTEANTKDRVLVGTVLNVMGIAVAAIGLIIFLAVIT